MRSWHSVSLFALALLCSACVTIPNSRVATVAGQLSAGAIWAETLTAATGDLSLNELLDMLQPQPERTCVPVPGFNICADDQSHGVPAKLAARSGAILMEARAWNEIKTALEQACRELGKRCSYDVPKHNP